MKVLVTIKTTETVIMDIGELPLGLIRDLLVKNDGTFDGNWAPADAARGSQKYVTDEVTVEPVQKAKG